jgi:hypothetical protein
MINGPAPITIRLKLQKGLISANEPKKQAENLAGLITRHAKKHKAPVDCKKIDLLASRGIQFVAFNGDINKEALTTILFTVLTAEILPHALFYAFENLSIWSDFDIEVENERGETIRHQLQLTSDSGERPSFSIIHSTFRNGLTPQFKKSTLQKAGCLSPLVLGLISGLTYLFLGSTLAFIPLSVGLVLGIGSFIWSGISEDKFNSDHGLGIKEIYHLPQDKVIKLREDLIKAGFGGNIYIGSDRKLNVDVQKLISLLRSHFEIPKTRPIMWAKQGSYSTGLPYISDTYVKFYTCKQKGRAKIPLITFWVTDLTN